MFYLRNTLNVFYLFIVFDFVFNYKMIIPYRGDAYFVRELKLAGDLGQVLFQPFHLQDDESIRKAVKYSNVVINLVGRDWETKNFKFNDVHVDGARRIARISREMGVERLIHLSALNIDPLPAVSLSICLPSNINLFGAYRQFI